MKKDPRVYLVQILERTDRILHYTHEGKEAFFGGQLIQDAVIRDLEIIGEAAKPVPEEFRQAHPSIPWRGPACLRDVLIHQYDGLNPEEVWRIVEKDLPGLKRTISTLLPPLDELERETAGDYE
jgi:uncharacterized protein with HEPN domain